jgi:hypothetical protein
MRFGSIFGAIVALALLADVAAAQEQNGANPKCSNQGGLFAAMGLCVQDPSNATTAQSDPAADGPANLSDQFYRNPAQAMVTYSTWQQASIVFQNIELNQGWFQVSFRELPTSVAQMNNQQAQGGGMNNFYSLSQGPNRFNSTYTIYCMFPPEDGSKIASIGAGETRQVSVKIKQTAPQTLIFNCRV